MSENYIMLNGKRVDLTDDQLEKLGLKVEKDCFERLQNGQRYYYICSNGGISSLTDTGDITDDKFYKVANYSTNEKLMRQRALHEALDRMLWRFSMQNDGDKIDWSDYDTTKYRIYFDNKYKEFCIDSNQYYITTECTYFRTVEIAQRAIDEIVLPFMEEHPEFVW